MEFSTAKVEEPMLKSQHQLERSQLEYEVIGEPHRRDGISSGQRAMLTFEAYRWRRALPRGGWTWRLLEVAMEWGTRGAGRLGLWRTCHGLT